MVLLRVLANESYSTWRSVTAGVLLGSILGLTVNIFIERPRGGDGMLPHQVRKKTKELLNFCESNTEP